MARVSGRSTTSASGLLHMSTRYGRLSLLASALVLAGIATSQPVQAQAERAAILQGLDKVTARISTISAPIDHPVRFGALQITARYCRTRPPEETPETSVFLEILELKAGEPALRVFGGWMFASSPALNALEHPVYDLRVIACKTVVPEARSGSE